LRRKFTCFGEEKNTGKPPLPDKGT